MEQLKQLYEAFKAGQMTFEQYSAQSQPLIDQIRQSGDLNALNAVMPFTPSVLQAAMTSQNQQEFMQKMQGYQGIAQGGVDLTQLAMAFDQIKTANAAARQTIPPGIS